MSRPAPSHPFADPYVAMAPNTFTASRQTVVHLNAGRVLKASRPAQKLGAGLRSTLPVRRQHRQDVSVVFASASSNYPAPEGRPTASRSDFSVAHTDSGVYAKFVDGNGQMNVAVDGGDGGAGNGGSRGGGGGGGDGEEGGKASTVGRPPPLSLASKLLRSFDSCSAVVCFEAF